MNSPEYQPFQHTPEEIALRSSLDVPLLLLPKRGSVFADRALRLRQKAADHAMRDYLMFMAVVCEAQHAGLPQFPQVPIPTQAQIFAIDTLDPLKRLLDMAGNPPAFVVLNLVHPNAGGRAADDAAAIAERFNVSVAPVHMSRLKAHEDAPALGQTAQELEPEGRAAQEIASLFAFLSEQASMIAGNHEREKA